MMQFVTRLYAALLCILIASCGGGGGREGNGASTQISTESQSVSFSSSQYIIPASQVIEIRYTGDGVLAGYPPLTTPPEWLRIEDIESTPNIARFKLSILDTNHISTRKTTLRFVTGREDGSNLKKIDIPLQLTVTPLPEQPHKIYAGKNGLAFTSIPGTSKLAHSIRIYDTRNGAGSLTASSSKEWLTASVSGGIITLTANPSSLSEGVHTAQVKVSSSPPGVINQETIHASIFVSTTAPTEGDLGSINTGSRVMSPTLPVTYIMGSDDIIRAYNIYSGALENTYQKFPGIYPSAIAVSSDGREIFAHGSYANSLYRLSLEKNEWTPLANGAKHIQYGVMQMTYMRPKGVPLIMTGDGRVINALDGRLVSADQFSMQAGNSGLFALHENQTHIAVTRTDVSGYATVVHYMRMDYFPDLDIFKAIYAQPSSAIHNTNGSKARYLAMSPDSSRIYLSPLGPHFPLSSYNIGEKSITHAADFAVDSNSFSGIAIDKNNVLYAANAGKLSSFNAAGALISERTIKGAASPMISGDGERVVLTGVEFVGPYSTTTYKLHGYPIN